MVFITHNGALGEKPAESIKAGGEPGIPDPDTDTHHVDRGCGE